MDIQTAIRQRLSFGSSDLTTTAVSAITQTGAVSGGDVVSDGGSAVTEWGVCWSTSSDPTTDDAKTTDGGRKEFFQEYDDRIDAEYDVSCPGLCHKLGGNRLWK